MGIAGVTSMVALDSSFMIKSLYTFRIPGIDYDFSINTTHVALMYVSLLILILAIVARIKLNKESEDETPGMFMNAVELIVEMLQTMVDGIMGKNANKFVNYLSTLFLFIIISNIAGLFGNIMSGTVLMGLIYDLLKPFTIAYPALLHAYFDLFSGCIQAYVFCMLTMVYVNDKIGD